MGSECAGFLGQNMDATKEKPTVPFRNTVTVKYHNRGYAGMWRKPERWSLWIICHQWKSMKTIFLMWVCRNTSVIFIFINHVNRLLCLFRIRSELECSVHVNGAVVFVLPPSSPHPSQIVLKPLGPSVVQYFRT